MPENFQDYFNSRINQEIERNAQQGISTKYQEVQQAADQKIKDLEVLRQKAIKQRQLDEASVVGRLGLNPNGIPGMAVNLGANAIQGIATVESNIATSIHTADAANIYATVPQEAKNAYARLKQGKATQADNALLGTLAIDAPNPNNPVVVQKKFTSDETNLQRIERYNEAVSRADQVRGALDMSSLVHQGAADAQKEQVLAGFDINAPQVTGGVAKVKSGQVLSGTKDVVSGLGGMLATIGRGAVDNKQATLELITQNIPQLVLAAGGAPGMALTNVPYAVDAFGQGLSAYAEAHNGAMPPDSEMQSMALKAASLAAAETLGDKIVLAPAAAKKAAAVVLGGTRGAAEAVTADAVKTGFKQSLLNAAKSTDRALASVGEGGVGEFVTEAYQTAVENDIKGQVTDARDVFLGGALGAVSGAGLSGGVHVLSGGGHEAAANAAKATEVAKTKNDAVKAAIVSGDVSALTDPKSPAYAPEKAVQALFGNSGQPDATPELKQANLEKANGVISELEKQREDLQLRYDDATGKATEDAKATLAKVQEKLAKADPEDTVLVSKLQDQVDTLKGVVDEAVAPDAKRAKDLTLQLSKIDRRLEQARSVMTQFHQDSVAEVDATSQLEAVNHPVDQADTGAVETRAKAAEQLITLSMAVPERLDPKDATALAENQDNGLTGEQRTYLRAFSEARVAENQLKDAGKVSAEIYTGGNGNVGLVQYRERVTQALATGNKEQADQQLVTLQKFSTDHAAKAAVVAQAWGQGQGTQVVKTKDGQWAIAETRRPYAEVRKNGGLTVNSPELVKQIQTESDAITKTVRELKAAYAVKFQSNPGVSNVSNVQEAPAVSQAPVNESAPAQGAGGDRTAATVGRVAGAGDGIPSVVSPGVVPADSQSSEKISASVAESQASPDATATGERTKGKPQSTNSSTQSGSVTPQSGVAEQPTADAAQSVAEPEQKSVEADGTLAAMAKKSSEGTPYSDRNLIGDYFTQSASKEGDATERPLVKVQDFFSKGWEKLTDFVEFKDLSEAQTTVLRVFKEKAASWNETMQRNLDRHKPEFFYTDLMQFLISESPDGKLDLEENVKTAMIYAAFSWIAENATRPAANTDEEINRILGREEDHPVEEHERRALQYAGTRLNVVSNALGQRAIQALGLKLAKDAPLDLMPRLESAFGAHIFKMLMDQGILVRTTVSAADMAALTGNSSTSEKADHYFLSLARNADLKLSDKADEIFKASMGTQGLLDKLFGVEAGLKEPSQKPIPFTQAKTRNTDQNVPSKLAEIIEHENAGASYVRQDMFDLVFQLDEDIALQIAGAKTVDPAETHLVNRASNEAKNDGLRRELDRFKAYVAGLVAQDGDLGQPLYFEHSVWKQQRVGIATNVVNPQTSKIHRHMLFRKTWESKVARYEPAQMENFHLRVAEGLGIKTDKQSNERSLEAFNKKVQDPKIQAAVAVLQKRLAGKDLSQIDQETLLAGVQYGGENMHSLDALMALAHEASNPESDTFTVQMMGEVDGVTNGPMLSHLLMGAANSVEDLFGLLNRGGFYEQGNEHNQYNLWREAAGHFDLYETTAGHMLEDVQKLIASGIISRQGKVIMSPGQVGLVTSAIYRFSGMLDEKNQRVKSKERNIIKTPLTAMVFGSSVGAAVESMANKFIDSIYGGIEDVAKSEDPAKKAKLITDLNLLLSQARAPMLSANMTMAQLMEHEFKSEQLDGLKDTFKKTVGAAVKSTMETDFAPYIAQRQQFNLAAQTSFELYNAVYTGLRDEMIAELIASGEITANPKTGEPLHDMTAAQENELRKRLSKMAPVMHTLMSKDSGSLKAGLYISKSSRKLAESKKVEVNGKEITRATPYEGVVKFGTGFPDNGAKSVKTRAYVKAETGPGVAMAPMSTHSTDSAISHSKITETEALNIHDAWGLGLANFQKGAQLLNQATWEAMLSYSPASEMFEALSRTVVGLAGLIQEGKLPPSVMENLTKVIGKLAAKQEVEPKEFLAQVVQGMKATAFKADDTKLHALSIMQAIDQYALQGGNYEVTNKDREEAAALRAALSNVVPTPVSAAVKVIEANLANDLADVSEKVETPLEEDPPVKVNPFGELGKPEFNDHPGLRKFFQEKPIRTSREVLRELYTMYTEQPSLTNSAFNLKLIKALAKTIPQGMPIHMLDAQSEKSDVLSIPKDPAVGWFVPESSLGGEIYVLGPDFKNSNLSPELLLHEMVHAATVEQLRQKNGANKQFIDELEAIRKVADEFIKSDAYTKDSSPNGPFKAGVSNVYELVAYGMTNQAFQNAVLSRIKIQSKTLGGLVDGMKSFVNTLARLLGFKDVVEANALGALIANVTELMARNTENKANQDKERQQNGPNEFSMVVNPIGTLNTYSTLDIHGALNAGGISEAFDTKLRDILGGIVDTLHGPFGAFKAALMKDQALTPFDVWLKALSTGAAPFASSVQGAPMVISEREAHAMEQVEATVRAAIERDEVSAKIVYRQLDKLYTEMQNTLKGKLPQDKYDYLFKLSQGADGRSNHLARFAAFGLANEEINKLLQVPTKIIVFPKEKTIAGKLQAIFESILEFFREKITHTYAGQRADAKLTSLVGTLVDIEAKKRTDLARVVPTSKYAHLEKWFTNGLTARMKTVRAVARSDAVSKSRFTAVRAVGQVLELTTPQQIENFVKGMSAVRDKNFEGRLGIVAGTMNYALGASKQMELLLRERKRLEGDRKDIITSRSRMALDAFANGGKDLAKESSASITSAFLRTGMHVLTDQFNLTQIEDLLSNKKSLLSAISTLEAQLTGLGKFKDEVIDKANALGYHKATGEVKIESLLMNASSIARLHGSPYRGQVSEAQAKQAEPVIEKLIALYALDHTDGAVLTKAREVLKAESARTDGGHGVAFVLALHKRLEEESKARLFRGNSALMVHGYTPEIYSPYVDVQTVTLAEGKKLEEMGYTSMGRVAQDPADPDTEAKFMYTLKDAGLMPFLTGIVAYTGLNAKGGQSKAHSGYMNVNTANGLANASTQADIMNAKSWALHQGPRRDLSKVKTSYMAPVLNEQGQIVNWRYLMKDSTKDTVMQRDNRFNTVLGVLAGSIFDKETVGETNSRAMEALKEQYDFDKRLNVEGYVLIGPKSKNAEDRETWAMLPEETKQEVKRIWGMDGMYVHNNTRDIVFGYRKLSLANAVRNTQERREWVALGIANPPGSWDDQLEVVVSKMFTAVVEHFYGKRAAVMVTRGEKAWQEIVQETKDLIVVKSVSTLMGNIKSNISLLFLSGVPPWAILKHHMVAWRGATSYEKDSKELDRLKTLLDTKQTNGKEAEMQRQVLRLKDAIARNPVRVLIENGLMPSIVEDTSSDDDIYSYKSALSRKVSKFTDKVPQLVKDGAKQIYISRDTTAYQTLRHITQLSDFVARYTQYQHLISRKENPLSQEDAIQQASDDFVNYDIPMHRSMQWLDDMGIFMFSKYYLRIQKVISRMFKENTARMLGALLLGNYMNLGPIVLDSSWVHKLGNSPLNWGALQYPGSLDELATVKSAMSLIK